ncbi:Endonuclease/exonuclease/phosphatase [Kalaharituber pfeilii]|nr:Endonuclease/exonuclease/phosphatase [Kalaharituber pfeilii]
MRSPVKLTVNAVFNALLLVSSPLANAITIPEIQGTGFSSEYVNQQVANVTGIVTAIGPQGFWLRSTTPDDDIRTSDSIYVYTSASSTSIRRNVTIGETITIDGKVEEYRSSKDYLFLTEITGPKNLRKHTDVPIVMPTPVQLGKDRAPPTELYSSLDTNGDIFAIPNNQTLLEGSGVKLQPETYGLDFWESLEGELVVVKRPVALNKPNNFGDIWVRGGDWKVTGQNRRGGLTIVAGSSGNGADANPEAIIVGGPLDGTSNEPNTRLGDYLEDITGVVTYAFGFYRILPLTALKIRKPVTPAAPPPTQLVSNSECYLTFGSYNVENLSPSSDHLGAVADHMVNYLKTPDLIFVQEVQDNDGPRNSGTVSANSTLATLSDAIFKLSGIQYSYIDISPVNNQDGGQPGGNIRVAYLYNPKTLALASAPGTGPGDSTTAVSVLPDGHLSHNPGRIAPTDPAWTASRKPLVATFRAAKPPKRTPNPPLIYAINVHFGSKGGSSSTHGSPRPPVNGGVHDRLAQATLVSDFIENQILATNPDAYVIASGDFNEFSYVAPMKVFNGVMHDLDEVVGIKAAERYSYLFDGNSQQLDHMLISSALTERARFEHIHVNTWATKVDMVSDHDPAVAKLAVCH